MTKFLRPVHPGLILEEELVEAGLAAFARQFDVPPNRVSQIIAGKRAITGDTALRFGHWFGVDPQFWINLQAQLELAVAAKETGEGSASYQPRPICRYSQSNRDWCEGMWIDCK